MTDQHLFDSDEGARRRDEAIARVSDHAPIDWKDQAARAVTVLALLGPFTTDDVWRVLDEWQVLAPPEPRAMGAVMRRLAVTGKIVATGEWVKSARAEAHRNPKAVWKGTT